MSVEIDPDQSSFGCVTKLSEFVGTSEPALRLLLSILAGKYYILFDSLSYIKSND